MPDARIDATEYFRDSIMGGSKKTEEKSGQRPTQRCPGKTVSQMATVPQRGPQNQKKPAVKGTCQLWQGSLIEKGGVLCVGATC
ncbi:MAG: hypothetical protein A4E45_01275 [Methanosaeta sp. PtaB.Bin039]|nr:MAG: hypothetical protein A4E45_01275 [Methanosaeta sp. PtaB.Bin039]OPY44562.1 MAG: hypothetical protein A4E47_01414 [Methanosaeta sp. PtaU1.Bin028]